MILAIVMAMPAQAQAEEFFVHRAADGTLHIARRALTADYQPLHETQPIHRKASAASRAALREKLWENVQAAAQSLGLDARLIDAMILVESGYDPQAVSHKGALGLMQLMPQTAKRLGVTDAHDPLDNIAGGVKYMAQLLREFNDIDLSLAAYNAGEEAVRRAKGIPNFPETINYVRTVKAIYERAGK